MISSTQDHSVTPLEQYYLPPCINKIDRSVITIDFISRVFNTEKIEILFQFKKEKLYTPKFRSCSWAVRLIEASATGFFHKSSVRFRVSIPFLITDSKS